MDSTLDEDQNESNNNLSTEERKDEDEYFMSLCILIAQRSKDPCTRVGACIVDSKRNLLGLGYNGMPRGIEDDKVPWSKGSPNPLENKFMYVCHAELNAIVNTNRFCVGCKIYVTLFPCNECAKLIIQHGITEVIYLSDKNASKPSTIAAKYMFNLANVKCRRFMSNQRIVFNFETDNDADLVQCGDAEEEGELEAVSESLQDISLK